jgi:hypothetical protein
VVQEALLLNYTICPGLLAPRHTKLRGRIKLAGKIKLGMADGMTRNALPRQAINKRVTILEPSRIYERVLGNSKCKALILLGETGV